MGCRARLPRRTSADRTSPPSPSVLPSRAGCRSDSGIGRRIPFWRGRSIVGRNRTYGGQRAAARRTKRAECPSLPAAKRGGLCPSPRTGLQTHSARFPMGFRGGSPPRKKVRRAKVPTPNAARTPRRTGDERRMKASIFSIFRCLMASTGVPPKKEVQYGQGGCCQGGCFGCS